MSGPNANLIGRPSWRQEVAYVDRRSAARCRPGDVRGAIVWRGAAGEVAREVGILNLSPGGAAVLDEGPPHSDRALRIHLRWGSAGIDPVEAKVVDTSLDSYGRRALHLQFADRVLWDSLLARPRERRLWTCYAVRETRASLTWLEGGVERTTHGALLNISGGGAAFVSAAVAPAGIPIWFRLESCDGPGGLEPVESRLAAISQEPSGLRIAHLRFLAPCPMDLFDLAVNGSR